MSTSSVPAAKLARPAASSLRAAPPAAVLRAAAAWAAALALISACAGAPEEPVVELSDGAPGGAIVRFPVRDDGTVDTAGRPRIDFATAVYDFGEVEEGAVVSYRFPFRNRGGGPLLITRAASTCGCTVPAYPEHPIAPGDTASILVRFDTEGKAGPQRKPVTLTANTYPAQTAVELVGTVRAAG